MKTITVDVKLNSDMAMNYAALSDLMGKDELFDYLEESVKKAINSKYEELTEEN